MYLSFSPTVYEETVTTRFSVVLSYEFFYLIIFVLLVRKM